MKTIWKYTLPLTDEPVISMQKGAEILSVGMQNEQIQVWALVDSGAPKELRQFRIASTGLPFKGNRELLNFLGTVQMKGGALIWHIFEKDETVDKCPECGGPATHPSGLCRNCHQSKLEAEEDEG